MKKFENFTSKASYFPYENIDTDQIINARFMKEARKPNGYGDFLFHDFNRDELNLDHKILLAKRNFGCGSSREAAVYALVDFGIKCVISPSFGDIFANNAVKNGLLLIELDDKTIEKLILEPTISIDLLAQKVNDFSFEIAPDAKEHLLEGLDDIAITMKFKPQIEQFILRYHHLEFLA